MPCPSHTVCPSGSMGWRCLCRKPQGAQRSPTPHPLQRGSCWGWGTGGKWVTPAFSQAQQSVSAMRSSTWRAPRGATVGARARAGCSATSSERAPHPRPPTCHASPLVPSPPRALQGRALRLPPLRQHLGRAPAGRAQRRDCHYDLLPSKPLCGLQVGATAGTGLGPPWGAGVPASPPCCPPAGAATCSWWTART